MYTLKIETDSMSVVRIFVDGQVVGAVSRFNFYTDADSFLPKALISLYLLNEGAREIVEKLRAISWLTVEVLELPKESVSG